MPACAAYGCSNRTEKGMKMFRFPSSKARRDVWAAKVKRTNWKPSDYSYLCEVHFDAKQFESGRQDGKRKLKHTAVPTLFIHRRVPHTRTSPKKRKLPDDTLLATKSVLLQREHSYAQLCSTDYAESGLADTQVLSGEGSCSAGSSTGRDYSVQKDEFGESVMDCTVEISTSSHSVCKVCDKLRKEIQMKDKQLLAFRKKYKKLLRILRCNCKRNKNFTGAVTKFLGHDQVKALATNSTRGSRWSGQTVKKSVQLLFACGSTGYTALLDQHYPLPSLRTLRRSLQNVQFESGILLEVFQFLHVKVKSMVPEEKHCCLTLDEMSITPAIDFDVKSGCFIGNVNLSGHDGIATHVLVFMLGGLTTRWKQTIAYFFTGNATDGSVFVEIVLNIVAHCREIGLNVVSVTSDMGSANRAMWKKLGIMCSAGKTVHKFCDPLDADNEICVFADVSHLLKNVRNHFVKDIILIPDEIAIQFHLPTNTVSVEHVKALLEYQNTKDLKPAPGLNEKHLQPSRFDKMKVSLALNVFNKAVSSGLKLLVENNYLDKNALTTAWFIDFMSTWFTIMSSRHSVLAISKFNEDKYRETITHLELTVELFKGLKVGQQGKWKPIQTGVILSTKSVLFLQNKFLNNNNFSFLLTSRFSQDCLENLFSCLRSKNAIPTAVEIKHHLRLLTVSQYLKLSSGSSYDLDDHCLDPDFLQLQTELRNTSDVISEEVVRSCAPLIESNKVAPVEFDVIELNCLYYLGGYILHTLHRKVFACEQCSTAVTTTDSNQVAVDITMLQNLRQYKLGALTECSSLVFDLILVAELTFRQFQHAIKLMANVKEKLLTEIESSTACIIFPQCHSIKKKLINRFVTLRLQLFARKEKKCIKAKNNSCHELSSKSMQMRKSVANIGCKLK